MITADTITDEQIRELRATLPSQPEYGGFEWQRATECEIALGCSMCRNPQQHPHNELTWLHHPIRRAEARARCAEILNARIAARRCPRCQSLCDHATWDGINCPWCARQAVL